MTRKIPPPPPGVAPECWSVPGEEQVLAEWQGRIEVNTRRVRYPRRIGMDADDVQSDLTIAMLTAIRQFAATHGALPPGQLLTVALHRRVMHLNRATRVKWRVAEDGVRETWVEEGRSFVPHFPGGLPLPRIIDVIPDDEDLVDDELTAEEQQEALRALVYALRRNLPPAAFAVLHLRIVEELTPAEIAQLTGLGGHNVKISRRVRYAKRRAWAFLRSLGIEGWEDVAHVAPEDIDG